MRDGLSELVRVARKRVVILTWDQSLNESWWLPTRYFPGLTEIDRRRAVSAEFIAEGLGEDVEVITVPVPHDCADGFDLAYWRRPRAYLDPKITGLMSNFAMLPDVELQVGMRRLEHDLADGTWRDRFGYLEQVEELDLGLRLVVAQL